jgi:HAE1 family hydrophobic/amphiphilic exporter-1
MDAALNGSKEIGFTIISMTLSLSAVFIPVLFMSGLLGRLLHEFAVTIVVAVLVSGFVSLTLTPMMCSRFVHAEHGKKHGRIYNAFERFFDRLRGGYDRTLQIAMRHRPAVMLVSLTIFVATVILFVLIPKGFFPDEDTDRLAATTEASQDISFDAMREHQLAAMKIVAADTNVDGFISFIGGGPSSILNNGRIFMRLKDQSQRKLNVSQVIQELRPKFRATHGHECLSAKPAAHPRRRHGDQGALSIQPAGHRRE